MVAVHGRGYHHDILSSDENVMVRTAVATHGRVKHQKYLLGDDSPTVRNAASKSLEVRQFVTKYMKQKSPFRDLVEPF